MLGVLIYSVSEVLFVCGLTCNFLSNLQFESMQYFYVCMTIMLSNVCMWTSSCHYACLLLFLNSRLFHLNSILRQLLFDEPMKDLVFVTRHGMRKPPPSEGLNGKDDECAFTFGWKNIREMCTKT